MALRLVGLMLMTTFMVVGCSPATNSAPSKPTDGAKPAAAPAVAAPAASPAAVPGVLGAPSAAGAARAGEAGKPAAPPGPAGPPPSAPGVAQVVPTPAPTSGPRPPTSEETAALPSITPLDRMVIYTIDLTLLVKSVQEMINSVGNLVVAQGGYLAEVENSNEGGVPTSTVRMKVAPDRYQATMSELRELAIEVRDEKATTQDVTEEHHDLQTQLASLEATHRQLLDLMARGNTTDEVLKIQQQAAQVKLQIDRLRGRATALERLSELATITAKVQSAEATLGKDYVGVRAQLRQAQSQYAAQLLALKRANTAEEEASIRDKLGELALQIERASARVRELEEKARQAGVTLPTPPQDESTQPAAADDTLQRRFVATRVQLRQAEARQADLSRRLKQPLPPEEQAALRQQLSDTILEINGFNAQIKSIQERATQIGVVLPTLTAEQEAILAGTTSEIVQPDPLRSAALAWEASLTFLRGALAGLLSAVVFVWWAIPVAALLAVLVMRSPLFHGGWPGRRQAAPPISADAREV
jgi:hypothetical protein